MDLDRGFIRLRPTLLRTVRSVPARASQ